MTGVVFLLQGISDMFHQMTICPLFQAGMGVMLFAGAWRLVWKILEVKN